MDLTSLPRLSRVQGLFERRPFTDHWFESEGLSLHCEVHGSGDRPLVFLHGILLDAQMNRRLAADLADRGNRVLLVDLPGHGESDKPRRASAHHMESYSQAIIDLLDDLDVNQAVVGGVSLGANASLHFAARHPERLAGLLLEMPVLEWTVPGVAVAVAPLLLSLHYVSPAAKVIAGLGRRLPKTTVGSVDSFLGTLALHPEEVAVVLHGLLGGPVAPTFEDRRRITAPALVVGHKADLLHPFSDAVHLSSQLKNARLIRASSIVELRLFPERLTSEIAKFLDSVWNPDGDEPASKAFAKP